MNMIKSPSKGEKMQVMVDFCLVPLGVGISLSKYIKECEKIFKKRELSTLVHGYGTNIEGPWDEVFAAIKECHEKIHAMGAPRITSTLKFGTRTDRKQSIQDKIEAVKI
jgi:uncharacterized protein (TIGR00106 family)